MEEAPLLQMVEFNEQFKVTPSIILDPHCTVHFKFHVYNFNVNQHTSFELSNIRGSFHPLDSSTSHSPSSISKRPHILKYEKLKTTTTNYCCNVFQNQFNLISE